MEKEIKITGDSKTVSAGYRDGQYYLRVTPQDKPGLTLPRFIWMTEDQVREVKIVLEEVLQHANKQDW